VSRNSRSCVPTLRPHVAEQPTVLMRGHSQIGARHDDATDESRVRALIQPCIAVAVPSYRHLPTAGSIMDMKLPLRAAALLWPPAPTAGLAKLAGRRSQRRTPGDAAIAVCRSTC
jgi:hypothetical protein